MTQTFKNSRKVVVADGWTNPITHDFQLENSAHLKVWADDTLLQLGVDYTLDEIGTPAGYEVNIVIPDPGEEPAWWGNELFILSVEPPIAQGDDLSLGGTFGVKFEVAIDKLTRRMQFIYDMAARAIKMPRTTDPSDVDQDDLELDPAIIDSLLEAEDDAAASALAAAASEAAALASEQAAGASEDAAAASANSASSSAAAAVASEAAAAASEAAAGNSETNVEADRVTVEGYRDEVEAYRVAVQADKVIAAAAADDAAAAQVAAEAARDAAAASLADFVDHYLGTFDELPTTDDDLSPLEAGDLAYATGNGSAARGMYVWDADLEEWHAAFIDGSGVLLKANNLSDLASVSTARTNLDVYSKAEVDGLPGSVASKTTPVDADSWTIWDSVASAWKRVTGTNLKAYLKTYFDTLYAAASHTHTVSALSDASANAKSLLQAANYAAMKTLLSLNNVDNTSDTAKFTNPAVTGTIREDIFTITDAAGFAIDPTNGSVQRITLGASRTPVAANWDDGESVTLYIADGSAFAITWSTIGVVWKGGSAPTLATSGWTEVNITKENGVYRGVHVGDFAS